MSRHIRDIVYMEQTTLSLDLLPVGAKGVVDSLYSSGPQRRRMLDLGIVGGTVIENVGRSPSGDPCAYFIRGAVIALRSDDAKLISVEPDN